MEQKFHHYDLPKPQNPKTPKPQYDLNEIQING